MNDYDWPCRHRVSGVRDELTVLQVRAYLIGLLADGFLPLGLAGITYIAASVARGSTDYSIRMAIFLVVLGWSGLRFLQDSGAFRHC